MSRKQYIIHYIYKTTNIITGKFYIGMHSTFDIDDDYLGSGKYLWRSIKKYGKENHKKVILEFCKDRIELKKREKEIVNEDMIHDKMCMNLTIGGEGGFSIEQQRENNRRSQLSQKILRETNPVWVKNRCNKISKNIKKQFDNGIRERKIFCDWTGRKHKKESIEKMKLSAKGKHIGKLNSQYGTCWIHNNKENKKIDKNELNVWIKNGWIKGRKMKFPGVAQLA